MLKIAVGIENYMSISLHVNYTAILCSLVINFRFLENKTLKKFKKFCENLFIFFILYLFISLDYQKQLFGFQATKFSKLVCSGGDAKGNVSLSRLGRVGTR